MGVSGEKPWRTVAAALGIAVAATLVIGGLALVGAMVLLVVGMSNFGSNK